jgi:hypothetical protein
MTHTLSHCTSCHGSHTNQTLKHRQLCLVYLSICAPTHSWKHRKHQATEQGKCIRRLAVLRPLVCCASCNSSTYCTTPAVQTTQSAGVTCRIQVLHSTNRDHAAVRQVTSLVSSYHTRQPCIAPPPMHLQACIGSLCIGAQRRPAVAPNAGHACNLWGIDCPPDKPRDHSTVKPGKTTRIVHSQIHCQHATLQKRPRCCRHTTMQAPRHSRAVCAVWKLSLNQCSSSLLEAFSVSSSSKICCRLTPHSSHGFLAPIQQPHSLSLSQQRHSPTDLPTVHCNHMRRLAAPARSVNPHLQHPHKPNPG